MDRVLSGTPTRGVSLMRYFVCFVGVSLLGEYSTHMDLDGFLLEVQPSLSRAFSSFPNVKRIGNFSLPKELPLESRSQRCENLLNLI